MKVLAPESDLVYITNANYQRIMGKIDFTKVSVGNGVIFKNPIYFFNKHEEKILLALQDILRDPDTFLGTYYKAIRTEDTYRYVYEGGQPAYHKLKECPNLNSPFKNFKIPQEIHDRGTVEVIRFRNWFKQNKDIFDFDVKRFVMLVEAHFFVKVLPEEIEQANSGSQYMENYVLDELEMKIENLIKEAGRFYYAEEKNTIILRRYSKLAFLAYKSEPMENNETGYSDDDVKALLKKYDSEFKKPIKRWLQEYYRVKYNPDLSFSGDLLNQLGFRCCSNCSGGILLNKTVDQTFNDLPF